MGSKSELQVSDMHILVLPYPLQGHINPMLQFAKRLASASASTSTSTSTSTHDGVGVRCTLAVAPYLLRQCEEPCTGAVHLAEISDGFDRAGFLETDGDLAAYLARLESVGAGKLDELLRSEAENGRRVCAVVYDSCLQRWVPPVARLHGAACVSFFTQAPAANLAYADAYYTRAGAGTGTGTGRMEGLEIEWEREDLPTFLTTPGDCLPYQELLMCQFQDLEAVDYVLVNSFHELQPLESDYMASTWGAKMVGPTVPSAYLDKRIPDDVSYGLHLYTPTTATTTAWLDAQPPRSVAYVSFGSMAAPGQDHMAEMAEGLHNSGKAFLWVVRASEASKIPDGFSEREGGSGRGLVVPWAAQLEVLAHPAIGCFVTHCGWNSTVEALCAGLPMVAVPQWSDQSTNAKYIEDVWHVGVRARRDTEGVVRREEVERCLKEVMTMGDQDQDQDQDQEDKDKDKDKKQYARNAAAWKEKALRAMCQGGSSDKNIVQFLQALAAGSRKSAEKSTEPAQETKLV